MDFTETIDRIKSDIDGLTAAYWACLDDPECDDLIDIDIMLNRKNAELSWQLVKHA